MRTETYFDPTTADELLSLAELFESIKWYKLIARLSIAHVLTVKIRYRAKVRYIKEPTDEQ